MAKHVNTNWKKRRPISYNNDKHDPGLTFSSRIGIASLDMKQREFNHKQREVFQQQKICSMIALHCAIESVQKNVDGAKQRTNCHCLE
jgi:hypothetical protein